MGRGNVCVSGDYEGLYYIDKDQFTVYTRRDGEGDEARLVKDLDDVELTRGDWVYDEYRTMEEEGYIIDEFSDAYRKLFPSFKSRQGLPDLWVRNGSYGDLSRRVLLENNLFYICMEDNQWSIAIELIQKEDPCGLRQLQNLQGRHFDTYLDGIKRSLFQQLDTIGIYTGPWTSRNIKREEVR